MNYLRSNVLFCLLLGVMSGYQRPSSRLSALLAEEWNYELRTNPEMATTYGYQQFNAELSDYSPAFQERNLEQKRAFLQEFEAIRPQDLTRSESLNRQLMIRRLRTQMEE